MRKASASILIENNDGIHKALHHQLMLENEELESWTGLRTLDFHYITCNTIQRTIHLWHLGMDYYILEGRWGKGNTQTNVCKA